MDNVVYNYHPVTRELIGQSAADESPLERGVLLLPAHSTAVVPPAVTPGHAAVFNPDAGAWSIVQDHRGQTVYSTATGAAIAIHDFGPLPTETTDQPRPASLYEWDGAQWAANIELQREAAWTAIKAERDRRTEYGGYEVDGKWFHSDQKSRSQQLGLVLLGANIPADLQWKTMDGGFVAMTQQLASQVLAAAAASDQATFVVAEMHKAAMEASADPAGYDFSTGWPRVFGED